jgi:hypothetical protein
MNKIILKVGLLAFCVAAVMFQTQGMPLMDSIARSFVIFILVVVGAAVLLLIGSLFRLRTEAKETARTSRNEQPAQQAPPTTSA